MQNYLLAHGMVFMKKCNYLYINELCSLKMFPEKTRFLGI